MMRWRQRAETDAERYQRLELLEEEMLLLDQKTPEQVVGDPFEAIYYGRKLGKVLTAGDHEAARPLIQMLLQCAPRDGRQRLVAAIAYRALGEPEEQALQLSIALALRPESYAVHSQLARLLLERGDREAAVAILEQGWLLQMKHLPRKEHAAARDRYFRLLDEVQPSNRVRK